MLSIDLKGKRALVAGVADDAGFGFAIAKALAEALRVTKTGGRIVVVEFSHPTWAPFRSLYLGYLMRALPAIARKTASNPDAYIYLAESIRAWPDQKALAALIEAAGWVDVSWKNLTGGVVAVHKARKP